MPIRMVEDENNNSSNDNYPGDGGNRGGGGGGGLPGGGFLGLLLSLLFRNPKIMIPLVIVGGLFYFFGGGCNGLMNQSNSSSFALGGELNQEQFDKAEVFEPLADNKLNPLPERVTLEKYAPTSLNQGSQGSCVAWSSAYAARTILYSQEKGVDPNQNAFSPAYLYNQIKLSDDCQGAYLINAMKSMTQQGALPLKYFPYNEESCQKMPNGSEQSAAEQFRMKGANRLTKSGDDYELDLLAIKQNLAQGAPVVIGMMVGGSFMQDMLGQKVWIPTASDYDMNGFGGHAMCVIGYDDYLEGGAFQLMNSWGTEWGQNGKAWVRYKDFKYFTKEAYGTYPMGNAAAPLSTKLSVTLGLINNATGQNIALQTKGSNVFATKGNVKKGEKFKMEITNTTDCYVYIFGEETDGSSYVLFPYTPKHSPYCGITGTRLFPKDYSMQIDDKGVKDQMAIVVTKKPIDYSQLNQKINSAKGDYAAKVNAAIAGENIQTVQYDNGEKIAFSCEPNGKNSVATIVQVTK